MKRRFARALAALALTLAACAPPPPPPNVVIYLVDTLRADRLGLYGYERNTSPRLDAFARDAVVYRTAWSPTSWTRPAAATLLTGRSPLVHGAITRANALDPRVPLLSERLRRAGYATAAFVTNVNVLPVWGFDRGFDAFFDVDSETWRARADEVNEVIFEHLEGQPARPYFWYVHTRDPHYPYEAPAPFDAYWPASGPKDYTNLYDAEVRANDHAFGALLDHLRERGLYRDALIIFTSDHGEEFEEHGRIGHGHSLFEELVRVPLVVKYPGNEGAGSEVNDPAALADLVPTVLAAAGIAVPADLEGVDLRGGSLDEARPLFFDLNLLLEGTQYVMDGVLLDGRKLIHESRPRPGQRIFDLARDPGELREMAAADATLEALLSRERAASQSGLHLAVVGRARRGGGIARGRLRTDGRFVDLREAELEAGDEVSIAAQGRELHFALSLPARDNPAGEQPDVLVDRDRIAFEVEPRGAEVIVESFELGEREGRVFLGSAREGRSAPVAFRRDSAHLLVERIDTLHPTSERRSIEAPAGLYVAAAERERREVEIDPELDARLRALGYAE